MADTLVEEVAVERSVIWSAAIPTPQFQSAGIGTTGGIWVRFFVGVSLVVFVCIYTTIGIHPLSTRKIFAKTITVATVPKQAEDRTTCWSTDGNHYMEVGVLFLLYTRYIPLILSKGIVVRREYIGTGCGALTWAFWTSLEAGGSWRRSTAGNPGMAGHLGQV